MSRSIILLFWATLFAVLLSSSCAKQQKEPKSKPRLESKSAGNASSLYHTTSITSSNQDNLVDLEKAEIDIAFLAKWWSHAAPRNLRYDAVHDSVHFHSVHVADTVIRRILGVYQNMPNPHMLARAHEPSRAYFISLKDILEALQIDSNMVSTPFNGIRVYPGLKLPRIHTMHPTNAQIQASLENADSIETHLYIVPAIMNTGDYIPKDATSGDEYAYDLTTPCPRLCDGNSPLYNASQNN